VGYIRTVELPLSLVGSRLSATMSGTSILGESIPDQHSASNLLQVVLTLSCEPCDRVLKDSSLLFISMRRGGWAYSACITTPWLPTTEAWCVGQAS
jgi:hypothetical protein